MNKFQAVFEILYILSLADGDVDKSEVEVILQVMNQNLDCIYFDPSDVIESINNLTGEGLMEELGTAVHGFKDTSTATERTTLMNCAVTLVLADGYITDVEKQLLHLIANTLNINLNRLLDKYA
ncbi:hypothetical protein MSj_01569 [Microcystis aeruginosa Sj]|jgi:uncharacterized tellurite resistance protein B-like protein|uniref:Co-chaperone DjlA N-terminal domain-containing protein n=2 Tax=Microcystis aeruginosa TaxID=1126 RepID=A0A2Z6UPD8_MICAE|nr:TerB family tellurite resistance protein [Microcystis aeruginosa]MDY7048201.1 TerB family tellurite resistance protein [Microcystis panniformis WG22]WNF13869.1 TerB family tellurite resistance protein [Microcystis aeruginosa NRERC-214]GBL10086.1 hypothetical protein MSj_01569 [Microcystis aeruginosa Sj]GCE60650.1 hypothetical protein MiAbB_02572 [Microcystis aeruginosa NIES-4285]